MPPVPPRRRRRWLRVVILVVALPVVLLSAGAATVGAVVWTSASTDTAGSVDFERRLAIPPLAESRVDEQGRRVFDLDVQAGETDFTGRGTADTWGVNGSYLGPTLRASRGETVLVNVANELGEATTLHWHGMHLPAEMEGGPHQMVASSQTWSPTWVVDQPAATLWYHPHLHGSTADHVYRGVAGMFVLDDPETDGLALPREYGVDDVPIIVQDKSFTDDGELDDGGSFLSPTGFLGDTVVVNGTVAPFHEVRTELVRLRLLNASNARVYSFGFADDRSFDLVGTDGGLLPAPYDTTRVQLSPGERGEIVVSLRAGESAVLRSFPADLGADGFQQRFAGGDDTLDVLELRAADTLKPSPPLPDRLVDVPALDEADAATTRTFRLSGRNINGRAMDMDRIDEVVTVDDTEIWEVTNASGSPHNFHVHDVQFQVLDVDGVAPPPTLGGWKDTVYVAPGSTMRLIMTFTDYSDADWPYMFHCHLLEHEDSGMMGQFVVVAPGQSAGAPPTHTDHAAHH